MALGPPSRRRLQSRWLLSSLGLAGALVYLVAYTVPYWLPTYYLNVKDEIYQFAAREPWRGVLFYAGLAMLFGLYLVACRLVRRAGQRGISAREVGFWALIFCLLLIPVQPLTSSDVYGYTFQGRIVAVLGENPYAHLYKDFAADPLYSCVTFHNLPATTGYGPLWIAVEAGLGWLARDRLLLNLLLFKGLAAGLHLLSAFLVYGTLKRLAPEHSLTGMLFYAWNPLLLHELVGNAHNDAAVAALALLGFYLLIPPRACFCRPARAGGPADQAAGEQAAARSVNGSLAAIPCLVAAALVKPVAVLWLPLAAFWLLMQSHDLPGRARRALTIGALVALPAVMTYAPFWAGAATFRGVLAQTDIHGNSLPNVLIQVLWSVWPDMADQIVLGVKLLTALIFVPFYLNRLWNAREDPFRASYDVVLFYLLFVGFQFMPWYLTWLMVPAALLSDPLRRRAALALCAMAPLLYFPFGWQWPRDNLPVWGMALSASIPLLALCVWLGMRAWQGRRAR
jgi:hypothetical protein